MKKNRPFLLIQKNTKRYKHAIYVDKYAQVDSTIRVKILGVTVFKFFIQKFN